MSRKPTLEPRWLVGLLHQWAMRSLHSEDRGLGYPSICAMLKDGIPGRVHSYEPTGYGDADFKDIDNAVAQLTLMRRLAVSRYYKPWTVRAIDAEIGRDTDTWLYHLKQAMTVLAKELDRKALEAYCA